VAWQYKTSIQNKSGAAPSATPIDPYYCHSFDLSKSIQKVHVETTPPITKNLPSSSGHVHIFKSLVATIEETVRSFEGANRVVRLILRYPPYQSASAALTLLKSHIRAKNLPVAILVLVKAWEAVRCGGPGNGESAGEENTHASLVELTRSTDSAFRVDGFGGLVTKPPGGEAERRLERRDSISPIRNIQLR